MLAESANNGTTNERGLLLRFLQVCRDHLDIVLGSWLSAGPGLDLGMKALVLVENRGLFLCPIGVI